MNANLRQAGQTTLIVLVFSAVSMIVLSGFVIWASYNLNAVFRDADQSQAFMSAESGIEYYRWHLAHAQQDYQDGTNHAGPYVHTFYDKDGNPVGTFSLNITPPPTGSTVVTVDSTGSPTINPPITKIIEAKMAIPSFAKYAAIIGSDVRFGAGTVLYGPVQSNGGIHMDGVAHNLVSSAVATYTDPDYSEPPVFGVYTRVAPQDPFPPAAVPNRPDVFMAGRQFPVAPADFVGITQDLSTMKTQAKADGSYYASSSAQGYDIIFKTNNTYDIYKVTALTAAPRNCTNSQSQTGWGTWSVQTETKIKNAPIPPHGVIFVEDNVWVSGQINGARVTVASGRFPDKPSTRSSITVNHNLLYSKYDGSDVISLIAQQDINVGFVSDDTLRMDAALMAQNGRIGRYYYGSSCTTYYKRSSITSYGMIGSYARYGWAYTDGTGYNTRTIIYDANMLYGPPPDFPLTADYYTPIFWNEAK